MNTTEWMAASEAMGTAWLLSSGTDTQSLLYCTQVIKGLGEGDLPAPVAMYDVAYTQATQAESAWFTSIRFNIKSFQCQMHGQMHPECILSVSSQLLINYHESVLTRS